MKLARLGRLRDPGGVATSAALLVLLLFGPVGCEDPSSVQDRDLRTFYDLYRESLEVDDAHLRAEALRMMEMFEKRRLPGKPLELLKSKDASPMVRVAALRTLLATDDPDAEGFALNRFTAGGKREKRAVLEAVLELGSTGFARRLVWRAIKSSQHVSVRRHAVREAIGPWVRRARANKNQSVMRRLLVTNGKTYIRKLDRDIGGDLLRYLRKLNQDDAAVRTVNTLADLRADTSDRVAAAEILVDSRADSAIRIFERILEKARSQGPGDDLSVPEEGVDERLVKWSVLGLAANGREDMVAEAKDYLKNADVETILEVLGALRTNPAKGARLAFESRLDDTKTRVRHRAIRWYATRNDARAQQLVETVVGDVDMLQSDVDATRRTVAEALADNFSEKWVRHISDNLKSAEGRIAALQLLVDVYEVSERTEPIMKVRDRLLAFVQNYNDWKESQEDNQPEGQKGEVAALAAYLLAKLPPKKRSEDIETAIRRVNRPTPRYAYLQAIATEDPGAHIDFLLDNFYPSGETPETLHLRLISGAGLWRAAGAPDPKGKDSESDGS